MYLNIGKNYVISEDHIVGIFDLDVCSQSFLTREYLSLSEKKGTVLNAADDIPNFFLITEEDGQQTVYLTQSMSKTMVKKIDQLQKERSSTWRNSMN